MELTAEPPHRSVHHFAPIESPFLLVRWNDQTESVRLRRVTKTLIVIVREEVPGVEEKYDRRSGYPLSMAGKQGAWVLPEESRRAVEEAIARRMGAPGRAPIRQGDRVHTC